MTRLAFYALGVVAFILALGVFYRFVVIPLVLPGVTVTSWWRSLAKNVLVGGVYNSRHLIGLAFDVVPPTKYNADKLRPFFKDVIIHDAGSGKHIHAEII